MKINKLNTYLFVIATLAIIVFTVLFNTYELPEFWILLTWIVIGTLSETLLIVLPNGVGVSILFAVSTALVLIYNPFVSCVVTALSYVFRITYKDKKLIHIFKISPNKSLYNVSQSVVLTGVTGILYELTANYFHRLHPIPFLVLIVGYIILNSVMISILMSIVNNKSFSFIWVNNIKGTLVICVAISIIGVSLAIMFEVYQFYAVLLFLGPLLLARYSFKLYVEMRGTYMGTIEALNKTVEAKDNYTSGHAKRVEEYAVMLAESLKLPAQKVEDIKTAAILHDIGKIGVDDSILKKPGKLTDEEFAEIKKHPEIGADILKGVNFLKKIDKIVRYHHERYDGKGYPAGLSGEEIPIEASILTIADVYDAMTSDRPYRKALTSEEAINEIKKHTGTQFSPKVAEKFVEIIQQRVKETI